jgi:hypothetical protein
VIAELRDGNRSSANPRLLRELTSANKTVTAERAAASFG